MGSDASPSLGRLQARVQCEVFLSYRVVRSARHRWVENHIPAMGGYHARDQDERMGPQKDIAKHLLASTDGAGAQPIGVRHIGRCNNVRLADVRDARRCQNVGHGIKRPERCVDGDLQDGGRRIQCGVNGANPT